MTVPNSTIKMAQKVSEYFCRYDDDDDDDNVESMLFLCPIDNTFCSKHKKIK